jgi:hypothetical protein
MQGPPPRFRPRRPADPDRPTDDGTWRGDDLFADLDRLMWRGATPTPPAEPMEVDYATTPQPMLPTATDLVTITQPDAFPDWFVQKESPPWEEPFVRSEPVEFVDEVCVPWYETWTPVLNLVVHPVRALLLTGVSYELQQDTVADGDAFLWRGARGGILLEEWEDVVLDNAQADPARRYAFGGHWAPVPFFGRIDHDEPLTLAVKVRGAFPFAFTSGDPFQGSAKVLMRGWQSQLRDTRQGAPKFVVDGVEERTDVDGEETLGLATKIFQVMQARAARGEA